MNGDGLDNLALLILIAMASIIVSAIAIFVVSGRLLTSKASFEPRQRGKVGVILGVVGGVAGVLLVIATFYESMWSPPLNVRLRMPPAFRYASVILLEDRQTGRPIKWHGWSAPFSARWGQIDVPSNGIVRVADLSSLSHGGFATTWSDGATGIGFGGGPAIPKLRASSYITVLRATAAGSFPKMIGLQMKPRLRIILRHEKPEASSANSKRIDLAVSPGRDSWRRRSIRGQLKPDNATRNPQNGEQVGTDNRQPRDSRDVGADVRSYFPALQVATFIQVDCS